MKKLSVMAPCYNGEGYVRRFLDSMLAQTHSSVELIVINDGSTDATEEILVSYEQAFRDKGYDYKHIYQENTGIGGALNNALKHVTGDYLTWFGTDDYAAPEYAAETVGFLEEHPEYAVLRCDGYLVDEADTSIIKGTFAAGNTDKHNPHLFETAIMERNGFHFGYSVIRMEVFDKVNPGREIYPSRQGQNWQLLLPVFYAHLSAFYEKPIYCVVDNARSVSRDPGKSYGTKKEQLAEYERILLNVLDSMDIADKDRYLEMVKLKYIRRRMCLAIDFHVYPDAIAEYKELKRLDKADATDFKRYLRAKIPIIDRAICKLKGRS